MDKDDEAFSWEGDSDPTLDAPRASKLPRGFTPVGRGADEFAEDAGADVAAPAASDADEDQVAAPDATAPMGNATLITIGVLAGLYAMWTIGWIIGGLRLQATAEFLVATAAYVPSLWLAALAPALWLGTVFLLTRRARTWVRVTWLIAGAVLLVPWPFVMTGTVGS